MQRLLSKCVAFQYPARNCIGLVSEAETRRLLVQDVRDCEANPLETETIELAPNCKRGRWLITGLDLDKAKERSFWYESMQEVEEIDLRAVQGKPIRVAHFVGDRFDHFEDVADPRTAYCSSFNEFFGDRLAVPVG